MRMVDLYCFYNLLLPPTQPPTSPLIREYIALNFSQRLEHLTVNTHYFYKIPKAISEFWSWYPKFLI